MCEISKFTVKHKRIRVIGVKMWNNLLMKFPLEAVASLSLPSLQPPKIQVATGNTKVSSSGGGGGGGGGGGSRGKLPPNSQAHPPQTCDFN